MQTNQQEWKPIEGVGKKKRPCDTKTPFALKRADHRNAILKGWASKLESIIEPKVPTDYVSPFDTGKCIYCETKLTGCPTGDEFRPSTQRGRQNIVNRVPCCGVCNPSKQDKCGGMLIKWINETSPRGNRKPIRKEQQEKILRWFEENEKYMLIPLDTIDPDTGTTYEARVNEMDKQLNNFYEFMK